MGSAKKKLVLGVTMILMGWVCVQRAAAITYKLTDIGSLGSGKSYAEDINSKGQITGYSFTASDPDSHAFLWSNGVMGDLGKPVGGVTIAYGINSSSQIVGIGNVTGDSHGFIYQNGTVADLYPLGFYEAHSINSIGQVTGTGRVGGNPSHGLLYTNGSVTDLGTLGGMTSTAWGINDAGKVVGESEISANLGITHAFLYDHGAMIDLGGLGGTYSSAGGINADGTIITGYSWIDTYMPGGLNRRHGFYYSGGAIHDLGTFGGNNSGAGSAPNASGDFVGWAEVPGGISHGFLYTGGIMKDLNGILDASGAGWTLSVASAINDSSWITGYGIAPGGNTRGFLLTPTPEPSAIGLLGLASLMIRRKRRRLIET